MISPPAALHVPLYALAETSRTGAGDFEITRNQGLTPLQKELFFVPHRKDFYMLAFVRRGENRHWLDMVPYRVQPDSVYFTAPDQVILKEDGSFEAISISFTQEFLDVTEGGMLRQLPLIRNRNRGHELRLSAGDKTFVDDILEKMLLEFEHREGWRNSMLLAYLRILLIHLSRLHTAQFPDVPQALDHTLFNQFTALVGERFADLHEVGDYAELLNMSAGHLSELIKKQSGKTPIEHIHDRLLLEAKRLLFHTEASMKEIAYQLGFEEASYFNRFFKRLTDTTPLSYRTAIREKYH